MAYNSNIRPIDPWWDGNKKKDKNHKEKVKKKKLKKKMQEIKQCKKKL